MQPLIASFLTAALAPTQDAAAPAAAPAASLDVAAPKSKGAALDTIVFIDAESTPTGIRTQFEPIPAGVAFEVWLDGMGARAVDGAGAAGGAAASEGAPPKHCVPVLQVMDAEWDEYWGALKRHIPPGDETAFLTVLLIELIEQKSALLHYRDELPNVAARVDAAIAKLRAGESFDEVVRVHSEDPTTRAANGIYLNDARGQLLSFYPLAKELFEWGEGQVVGPIFKKEAVYLLRIEQFGRSPKLDWFDKVKASAVIFRYTQGPNVKARGMTERRLAVRVRSEQERFLRMLPPGLQHPRPTRFGPSDVAPVGAPETPLQRRHIDDEKDGVAPARPARPGEGSDGGQ